ncbi:MAG: hypothetical protein KJZ70_00340 [Bryobacterales bacterium]|nr:hypothetical protein [Bryobacterales bacterium]
METLLTRYRGVLVLVLILAAQLVMLGVQVRNQQDIRLVRVWAISAVTPLAMILDGAKSAVTDAVEGYVDLRSARKDNVALKSQVDTLRRQNEFLKAELATADRADRLLEFKQRIPSRTIAARIIGTNAAPSSQVVFVDRGASDGLVSGMAVINGTGVVGRVLDAYPNTAQVMLITDPSFAMGVISQKGRVVGTLRGLGQRRCMVDYVESHLVVEKDEWFYSSGDDRVFPRGLPIGPVVSVAQGNAFQDIYVEPAAMQRGLDEVLIVLEAVHQTVPPVATEAIPPLAPAPEKTLEELPEVSMGETSAVPPSEVASGNSTPAGAGTTVGGTSAPAQPPAARAPLSTDADRLLERYRRIGQSQNHPFGGGSVGTPPPDFNRTPAPPETVQPGTGGAATGTPAPNSPTASTPPEGAAAADTARTSASGAAPPTGTTTRGTNSTSTSPTSAHPADSSSSRANTPGANPPGRSAAAPTPAAPVKTTAPNQR